MTDLDLPALRRKAEAATQFEFTKLETPVFLALVSSAERLAKAERLVRDSRAIIVADAESRFGLGPEHYDALLERIDAFLANASPTRSQDVVGEIVAMATNWAAERNAVIPGSGETLLKFRDAVLRRDWRKEKPDA